MSLILSGCGGKPLSQREIVRGVLFTQQKDNYSVCLVLANQQETEAAEGNRVVAARGNTPAQALQQAEESLHGDAYYGLLDLAALPSNSTWQTVQEIGTLLYDNAQPAPELSVFLLGAEPIQSWARQGSGLYNDLKSIEDTYQVHCGLQQLFTQANVCAIPVDASSGGYGFALLAQEGASERYTGLAGAQLAAVLCGQSHHLQGTFSNGTASCEARVQVTVEEGKIQLHLREAQLKSLTGSGRDLEEILRQELTRSFAHMYKAMEQANADPFHLRFWQACTYGPNQPLPEYQLQVFFE